MCRFQANALPAGGVVQSGTATITTGTGATGLPVMNIAQTSGTTLINWTGFNIAQGEAVNFSQPQSSSVAWNFISDTAASTISGSLDANGVVILQNPHGFTVNSTASISTHGLIMTTAPTAPPANFTANGPWTFTGITPIAKIQNFGQIDITGGGSVFLIAGVIFNEPGATISAPGGSIGLYDGKTILVSTSPNGEGLSAEVTLPAGSVNNQGSLIADAGSILASMQTVNQNGLIQADSAQNVNGTIELVAGGAVSLNAGSTISAEGNSQAASGGGVTLQAGTSVTINNGSSVVADGSSIAISAPTVTQSGTLQANALGTIGGSIGINAGTTLNVNNGSSFSAGGNINLQAGQNLILNSPLSLDDAATSLGLYLSAGNDITLNGNIQVGQNWSVNLNAGTSFFGTAPVSGNDGIYLNGSASIQAENGNINLYAANEVQIQGTGGIRTIGISDPNDSTVPAIDGGNISVTALYGDVNTGTGINGLEYHWLGTGTTANPYYTPFTLGGVGETTEAINFSQSSLSGIGTAAGGNITINAGLDVISFPTTILPIDNNGFDEDPGTGVFGPEPGNVTINAGRNVSGNFMEINGNGTINAGGSIGFINQNGVANYATLSLASGSWTLNAQDNIYLTEVLNPNGVFNDTTSGLSSHRGQPTAGNHLFDYSPTASVSLTAGNGVYIGYSINSDGANITGAELQRPDGPVPMILPPIVTINAGAGGVNLYKPSAIDANGVIPNPSSTTVADVTMFPSPYANLDITTTDGGSFNGQNGDGDPTLLMSDSAQDQWVAATKNKGQTFSINDDASVPAELNNSQPVTLNISGSMNDVTLLVSKSANISVVGNMDGCSFFGENLQPDEATSITVGGQIFNPISFNSVILDQGFASLPVEDLPPTEASYQWFTPLELAVNPTALAEYYAGGGTFFNKDFNEIQTALAPYLMFSGLNNNLAYDPTTQQLTAAGPLSAALVADLEETLVVPRYLNGEFLVYPAGTKNAQGVDISGQLETDTITLLPFGDASQLQSLESASQNAPGLGGGNAGAYIVGGTGQFNVTAGSISLGNSYGILTVGNGDIGARNYSFLPASVASGATINVTAGYLQTPASAIAALSGGDVNVNVTGDIPNDGNVSMDLGSQSLVNFEGEIMNINNVGLGIYTSGGGDVNITSYGSVNIDSSRVATFNGGNVNITSLTGNVDAGSGGTIAVPIDAFAPTYYYYIGSKNDFEPVEYTFANGIVTENLANSSGFPNIAVAPGSITVNTPEGDIDADLGGILQESLNGALPSGPTISLFAGTPAGGDWNSKLPPVYVGNINLGDSGVIGGSVIAKATGNINGLIISQQNSDVVAQQNFSGTILSGGSANVSAAGSVSGTIIGASGVNASGAGGVSATLLGQNVSVNGSTGQSTLGNNATASASSQSAAQQSTQAAAQQVASNTGENDDEKKKKKKPTIHVGRVTVILSAAVPPR